MKKISSLILGLAFSVAAFAQVQVNVHETAENQQKIHKEIYGQFAEHLGRCIYDGIWVGPDTELVLRNFIAHSRIHSGRGTSRLLAPDFGGPTTGVPLTMFIACRI